MDSLELEVERANRNASLLRSSTNTMRKNNIHVSYNIDQNQIFWSVRLNEIGNRVTHLSFFSVVFLMRKLLTSIKEFTGETPSAHWPGIRGSNRLTRWLGETEQVEWKGSNGNIFHIAEMWSFKVNKMLRSKILTNETKGENK